MKKSLTLIGSAATALAIVIPTASANLDRSLPALVHAKKAKTVVAKIAKRQAVPRNLCICITGPSTAPALSEQDYEAQANQDAIDHDMPPVYDTTSTDSSGGDASAS